jgi:hypothetical protein
MREAALGSIYPAYPLVLIVTVAVPCARAIESDGRDHIFEEAIATKIHHNY